MANAITETFTTTDHYGVLNAGGLLLINEEALEEEMSLDEIARYDETLLLSPGEALRIAALIEKHRVYLEAREQELNTYFGQVAQAWINEFTETAQALCKRDMYWWPEIRNEARHILIRLTNTEANPILTAWYKQAQHDVNFPHSQQETLLTRHFKRLYYEQYPMPVDQDSEGDDQDESEKQL